VNVRPTVQAASGRVSQKRKEGAMYIGGGFVVLILIIIILILIL
jgi:hypothetical protein